MTHPTDQHPLELLILNAAFDAGGSIAMPALREAVPARGVDIRKAISTQRNLGNLRQSAADQPIALTASARAAIAAGRAHRPMMIVTMPARRCGKTAARMLRQIGADACLPGPALSIERPAA
ncbi:MAG: hypothetical protein BGP16_12820 [Sphingobium sp. 66-54]|nr:MAG: hypothetical protein BGP16_12820 [Sphingobium sp. 66-54]